MPLYPDRRRVLVASGPDKEKEFHNLFAREPLDEWELLTADSFSKARFNLQHNPCDVLVVSEDLYDREGNQALTWLTFEPETPVVFLAGPSPEKLTQVYEQGVTHCVQRDMALVHPPLLAAVMNRALQTGELSNLWERTKEQLSESRQHVDRLVNLIWRMSPRQADQQWYSQRYMLERLQEELARAERHGVPFTLAIGELQLPATDGDSASLPSWTADIIVKVKRRCDVAGQYGPRGFLLLMAHTAKPGGVICCRRLRRFLEQPNRDLRVYFGIASAGPDRFTPQALLRAAEENLETARTETSLGIYAGQ